MMLKAIGVMGDRLVSLVVPKTTAGACPCNDCFWSYCGVLCPRGFRPYVCRSCNCSLTSITCHQGVGC